MNKDEFMKRLEHLLLNLPADEREEALRYYQDYFDDAGVSEESRIIEELGTPEKVAQLIKGNLYSKSATEAGEYTERGYYSPYEQNEKRDTPVNYVNDKNMESEGYPINRDRTKTLLIVALIILSCPLWIAAAGAIFGIILGFIGTIFGLTVGFGAASLALFISAIALIAFGIAELFTFAPLGAIMIGVGLILIAIGLLFLIVTILVVGKLIPAIIRGLTSLIGRVFNKTRRVIA